MTSQRQKNHQPARDSWQSLGQLAELWGLSRARTRVVLKALVRSGRMEVRTLRRDRHQECEYRVVERS